MIRHLVIILVALIGDLTHVRLWLCITGGSCVVALAYFIALPFVLPVWLALMVVGMSGIIGLYWERHAS